MGTREYTCEYSQKICHWPIPVGSALGDPWEIIFTDLGATFGPKIPMGTDLGHPWVHSCPVC